MSLAEKLFGSFSDRELKKINPLTKQVLALEGKYQAMSDAELQAQTPALKQQLADGKTLDNILPDAFAVCREAAWRVLGMKHFPVQVTGGIALHRGDIAEMQTPSLSASSRITSSQSATKASSSFTISSTW